jgi:hypothetical protein
MKKWTARFAAAIIWSIIAFSTVYAGSAYTIVRFTLEPGGSSQGGGYTLASAVGQPVVQISQGEGYVLAPGFFFPAGGQIVAPLPDKDNAIFLPYTSRQQ